MSYTKQTWNSGDVITAAKLNHIEDGIAEGGGGSDLPESGFEDIGKVLTVAPLYSQITVFANQSGTIRSDGSVKIPTFAINPVSQPIPNGIHGTFIMTVDGFTDNLDVVYDSSTYSFSNDDWGFSIAFSNVFEDEAWIINGFNTDDEGLEVTATLKYDGLIYGTTPAWQTPSGGGIVEITYDIINEEYVSDVPYSEILDAIKSKKAVSLFFGTGESGQNYPSGSFYTLAAAFGDDEHGYSMDFSNYYVTNTGIFSDNFHITEAGVISRELVEYPPQ